MSAPVPPVSFSIDQPASWRLAAPTLEITGWLHAESETACLDIRARIDRRVFLGLYGLDRDDLVARFPGNLAARRSGFRIAAHVWTGARAVALDWQDTAGAWHEFFRADLDLSALPSAAQAPKVLKTAYVYETLDHLYRACHSASFLAMCREADRMLREVLVFTTEVPRGDGVHGFIETPGYWLQAQYDKFRVTGWTFGIGFDIARLHATTGVGVGNRLIYPKERQDVAEGHPEHANALRAGFYGLVDVRADLPGPAHLRIYADQPDGRRLLIFSRRMFLDKRDEHSGPVPVFRPWKFLLCRIALLRGAVLGQFKLQDWKYPFAEIRRLRADLDRNLGRHVGAPPPPAVVVRRSQQDPYSRWVWHNRPTPRLLATLDTDAAQTVGAGGPLISVVVPAYNTPERYLRELLDCLRAQLYPRWELCIADDASPQPHVRRILEEAARTDARIRPVFRTQNGHISRATNSALEIATGKFVALLDHDDLLPPDALLHIAQAILAHPTAGYLYTDEDKIDDTGRRFDPQFKGDWSPEMAITHNYTHHLTVVRRSVVNAVGGLRPEFNGAQDIDLFLRCFERIKHADVVHVPFVCYHWRAHAESTASRGDQKGYLFDAARRAIAEACQRRGLRAEPMLPEWATRYACCLHQLRWDPAILRENPVTIVIPTKNRGELLARCLDSLVRTTPRESVNVVVVNDGSDEPTTLDLLRSLPARADLRCIVLDLPADPAGFNYSRLVNAGSARADTPLLLHLNNDVEALRPGWLEDLAGWLTIPDVGVVGAKLLYPDSTINHAGIGLSRHDRLPHTLFEREPSEDLGLLFLPHAARNVAAVTGACLLTRTALYRELGGFDETDFRVAYNDVDFCLRAWERGQRVVVTPQAVLQHVGSASRGREYTEKEHLAFVARHGAHRDPFLSDTYDFPPAAPRLNPYHYRYADTARPLRMLLVTHNLKFEGAPILLFEQARHHAAQAGVSVRVVSPEDGPLRARYEALGIPVETWDVSAILAATDAAQCDAAIAALATTHPLADVDLVVGNTVLTFWTVPFAARLNKPSLLYVYESCTLDKLFARAGLPARLREPAEAALRDATRVCFAARATEAVFQEQNHHDNFRLVPSSVDLARIQKFVATSDRAALRRKHGIPLDVPLVINVGSVCERKGQHVYLRGIDRLRKDWPATFPGKPFPLFLIIGARDGLYLESIQQDIALLGLAEVRVLAERGDIDDFFRMADLLVCTSFEESFPRVLLEAMAFGVRIVSTDVFGIPEMLVANDEAHLIPAGDPAKLAAALSKAFGEHFAGDDWMVSMARARVHRYFDTSRLLPLHLALCREAALG
jgi:GT2 family glycosyltransferase/glycosyltransferase involved in cell wall biosynthesis